MRLSPSRAPVLIVLALAAVLVGCGGGGGGTSKDDYRKQLQQIDQEFRSRILQPEQQLARATTVKQRIAALSPLIPRVKALADKVDGLTPPKGLQDEQDRVVAALRKESADMTKLKAVLAKRDVKGLRALVPALTSDAQELSTAVDTLRSKVSK